MIFIRSIYLLVERSEPSVALIVEGTIAAGILVEEGALVVWSLILGLVLDGTRVVPVAVDASPPLETVSPSVVFVGLVIDIPKFSELVELPGIAVIEISELELETFDCLGVGVSVAVKAPVVIEFCVEIDFVAFLDVERVSVLAVEKLTTEE